MHVLNVMAAVIGGFSNRNEKAVALLDDYAQEFPVRDKLVAELEKAAAFIIKLGFRGKSYWLNKANVFSLTVAVVNAQRNRLELRSDEVRHALDAFEKAIPDDYKLAATEAVNSTRARQLRNRYLSELLQNCAQQR